LSSDQACAALAEHRSHAESDDSMVVHRSRVGVVTRTSAGLCVKEWYGRGWKDALRARPFGSKAMAAWRAARGFCDRGVGTPEPLAVIEEKGGCGSCYLVTRFHENARPLNRLARDMAAAPDSAAEQQAVARAVGLEVGKLHAAGVYHGDLSAKNFLVEQSNGGWKASIIDLDNVRFWRPLTRRRRLKSLSQLNDLPDGISLRGRIAFVRAYNACGSYTIGRRAMKEIARLTCARSAARDFRPPE
jgi:hypothetical protein